MTKATTEPLAIRAKLGYATTAVFIEKFGPNVSQKGFFLKTKAPKPQGTSLRFLLRIDDDTTVLRGIGTVAWVRESDIDGKPAGMGIRFDRVDAATRDIIRQIAAHKQANNIAGPSRYSEAPEAVTEVDLQDVDSLLANLSGAPEAEAEEAEAARKAEEAEAARKAEEAAARKAAEEAAARKAAEEAAARKAAEEAAARKAAEEAAARKAAEEAAARKAAEEAAARKAAEEAAARKAAEEAAARKAAEEEAARKAAEEAAARAAQKVAQDLGKIEADDFEIDDVISAFDTIQVAEQVAPEVPGGQIKITAAGMDDGVRFEVSSSAEFDASMEAVAAPAPAPAVVPTPASVPAPPVASVPASVPAPPVASVPASVPAPPVIPYSDTATADEAFFFSDGDEIEELSFSDGDEIEELSFSDGDEIEELSFSDGDEIEELSFSDGDEIEELSSSEETPAAVENAISDETPKPRVTTGGWSEALFSADIHEAEADLAAVAFASDMGALDEIENPDTYRIDAASDDPMAAFIDRAASETRMPKSPTAPLMSTDETLDTAIEDMFAPGALMPGAAKSSPEPVLDEAPDALPDDALPPSLAAHVMRRRSLAPPPPMPEESVPPLAPKPSWPPEDYVPDDDDDLDFPPKRRGLFGKIFGKK